MRAEVHGRSEDYGCSAEVAGLKEEVKLAKHGKQGREWQQNNQEKKMKRKRRKQRIKSPRKTSRCKEA